MIKALKFYPPLLLGIWLVLVAAMPLVFSYPYSSGSNSGPRNTWELIVMISYDSWGWFLMIGIAFIAYVALRQKRARR
ncbi:hypothetical protein B1748_28480 [Paenibacillus sp. MY03]|uniref:hypothetical protein n=1 Tax=Paenibacillus sp. MY03 TaxID=302980 RepID=UPI000B3CE14D|nr:hypothetical protein [Paenibacillus sp. MY03]OUS70432.1 hypothetical protein B1748_28480 [Paenibacillus sp. MY03]